MPRQCSHLTVIRWKGEKNREPLPPFSTLFVFSHLDLFDVDFHDLFFTFFSWRVFVLCVWVWVRETVESRHLQCGELGGSLVLFPPFFNYFFFFFFGDVWLLFGQIMHRCQGCDYKCRDRWTRRMIRMICGRQDGYTVRQRWENESDGLAVGQWIRECQFRKSLVSVQKKP